MDLKTHKNVTVAGIEHEDAGTTTNGNMEIKTTYANDDGPKTNVTKRSKRMDTSTRDE
jgi:hypothetical protein